jgi:hypothetical protein
VKFFGTPIVAYLPAFALLAIAAVYLVTAYSYMAQAREFPVIVAWATIAVGVLDVISRTHTIMGDTLTRWFNPAALGSHAEHQPNPSLKQVTAVFWVAGFVALIVGVGFLYAVPIYVFASIVFRGGRPYWFGLAASAATTLFIWVLFSQVLELELYPGMLFSGN